MWCSGRGTRSATVPTVRAQSDGTVSVFAAVESDHAMTPLCFVDDEYIDVDGGVVAVSDALAAVLSFGIDDVGESLPIETAVLSHPTEWGSARRDTLSRAGARVASTTVLVPVSVAVAQSAAVSGGRWVVLECRAVGATASYVVGEAGEYRVQHCEHDSALCVEEAPVEQTREIVKLAKRACGDRPVDGVLVTGIRDPSSWESMRDAALAGFASNVQVRCIPEDAVARVLEAGMRDELARSPIMVVPQSNWLGPALRRSGRDRRRYPRSAFAAVVAVVAVVLGAVLAFAFVQTDRTGDSVRAADSRAASEAPTPPTTGAPSAATAPDAGRGDLHLDGVRVTLPDGWSERKSSSEASSGMRAELIPNGGADRRIIVTQNVVQRGTGYDEVAAALSEKIAQRGSPGLFGDVERDVVFGGRPGISYGEFPDASSSVSWHVLVERGRQVSVGCQFLTGDWESISRECEGVVRSLIIAE
ncbi:type VII secretion-associated protein [Rhodococcus sp. WMMA185]|nr:type VII secretion-associated protein [Rhodococcus sp. WMMA185]